jgi:iron complex outermembrane receptor protein
MRRFVVVIILFFVTRWCLFAQSEILDLADTVHLQEITSIGQLRRFQAGAKIEEFSSTQILSVQEGGIEQLLMRFTPIYVKSNAGGLASIHIRGTSADHTSIMFGGINVNSLTLGQSNLSNITSFLFDKIQIQYGSSAALNGSGAIGGALYLGVKNNWTNGVNFTAKSSIGSFGERLYGTKIYLGNGKWELVTRLLSYKTENDFSYTNYSGFGNADGTKETQDNAAVNNKGFIQEFNYQFGSNEYFKSMLWYEDSWHEIQPSMTETTSAVTELKDDNIRFWGQYCNENHLLKFMLGGGFVHDKEIYNNDSEQYINTDRLILDFSMKHPVMKNLEYKVGVKYKYIVPDVYSYSDSADLNEHDADFYFVWFYQPFKRLKTTINLRQQLVSNYNAPFTPAFGLESMWIRNKNNKLNSTFNISRSYRIPTFNDRYWPTASNPQGTTDLEPEDGFTVETGIDYQYNQSNFQSTLKVSLFYMDIKNWLEWRNINGAVPVNLDKVISKGIEVHMDAILKTGDFTSSLTGNYTCNPSTKIEDDKPDQQLIYIPKHMFNACYSLKYRKLTAMVDGSFTGERFYAYISSADQEREALDSYFLTNCMLNYNFNMKKQNFVGALSVNNIFDVDYQNQYNYAMPGLNFRVSLTANINFKNINAKDL